MSETVLAPILERSRSALARAATLLENDADGATALHASLATHCGRAHVVGVTGAPGVGKSTLVNALLGAWLVRGRSVAVIAVDPSSPFSGGAILGDRIRMSEHAAHDAVFVRSLASRGHLGGLSLATGRLVDLFDAAGFDLVVVETVGTGQSEVEVRHVADTRVVVCAPGLGDDVQAIKAGILEIADLLVVNKADSALAARTLADLRALSRLRRQPVEVLATVASRGEGVDELVERIAAHGRTAGVGQRLRGGASTGATSAACESVTLAAAASSPDTVTAGFSPALGSAPALAGTLASAATPVPATRSAPAPHASDAELFAGLQSWRAAGQGVALATVVRTWGSSPRAEGSLLAVAQGGAFLGSVSGGCVEGAVISGALEAIADGRPRLLEFGVSDEQAWEVGLACGGKVQVYVERIA